MSEQSATPTILIADGDARGGARLSATLRARFTTVAVRRAAAARRRMGRGDIAAVVVSAELEDDSGVALLEWAAREHPEVVRIAVVGVGDAAAAFGIVNRLGVTGLISPDAGAEAAVDAVVGALERRARAELSIGEPLVRVHRLETLSTVVGGIALDFNNLLTVVLNCTSTLEDRLSHDQDTLGLVSTIRDAITRAGTLTEKLVAFARARDDRPARIQVNDTIREVLGLLSRSIRREIAVELDLDDELPAVEAHAGELHQCLLNLCLNALEAMGERGRLTVHSSRGAWPGPAGHAGVEPGEYVEIRVVDTGAGMGAEQVSRAFEPFYSTKRRQGGVTVGLGLAVARRIVQRHDGSLELRSTPGRGTVASILLPAADVRAQDPRQKQKAPPRPRIVMADDEPAIRRVGVRILEREGYEVLPAEDGKRAVEIVAKNPDVALVILDLVMPVMDGESAYAAIREHNRATKFLVCTGHAVSDSLHEILRDPGVRLIHKPYSISEFTEAVRDILG